MKPAKNKKFLFPALLLVLFLASGCAAKNNQPNPQPNPQPKENPAPVACTMEAKLCPDGSAVGRTGPKCEFAPCP